MGGATNARSRTAVLASHQGKSKRRVFYLFLPPFLHPAGNQATDVNPGAFRETDSYWPIDTRVKHSPIKLKGVEQIPQRACKKKKLQM